MYAIVATGGKQHLIKKNDIIEIEKVDCKIGDKFFLNEVLLIRDNDENIKIGKPFVDNAKVLVEITDLFRSDKVIVFKKRRRKGYSKTKGHRQTLLKAKILDIVF